MAANGPNIFFTKRPQSARYTPDGPFFRRWPALDARWPLYSRTEGLEGSFGAGIRAVPQAEGVKFGIEGPTLGRTMRTHPIHRCGHRRIRESKILALEGEKFQKRYSNL